MHRTAHALRFRVEERKRFEYVKRIRLRFKSIRIRDEVLN